jgi:cytochrome c2
MDSLEARPEIAETSCGVCHSFGKDEAAELGFSLYAVVGAARARMARFNYTSGLSELAATGPRLSKCCSDRTT